MFHAEPQALIEGLNEANCMDKAEAPTANFVNLFSV